MKLSLVLDGLALAAIIMCSTAKCDAQGLESFPPYCQTLARINPEVHAAFVDGDSPNANKASNAEFAFTMLTMKHESLLLGSWEGALRSIPARVWDRADQVLRRADARSKIRNTMDNLIPISLPSDTSYPHWVYYCITDTCPSGSSCQEINVSQNLNKILHELPNTKIFHRETLVWARNAGVSPSRIRTLRAIYTRHSRTLKKLAKELQGKTVFVLKAVVPRGQIT